MFDLIDVYGYWSINIVKYISNLHIVLYPKV